MTEADAIAVLQDAVWTMLLASTPVLLTALVVGLVISFLQAITQIQEMTLSFVPKVLAICGVGLLTLPFVHATLAAFTQRIFDAIASGTL